MDQVASIAEWLVGTATWATTTLQTQVGESVTLCVALSHTVGAEALRALTSLPDGCHEVSTSASSGLVHVCVVKPRLHRSYEVSSVRPIVPSVVQITLTRTAQSDGGSDGLQGGMFAGLAWITPDGMVTRWDRSWRQYRCRVASHHTGLPDGLHDILAGGFRATKFPVVEAGGNGGNDHITMQVLATGDEEMLCRPCVDCGLKTGRFCDHCLASTRVPSEEWASGQMTPLCSRCDWDHGACHYCFGLPWCTPFPK
jgi:hypothetical protein